MRNIFRHLFISVALTVSTMSYCNAANTRATEQQDTIQHLDTTVIVAETDSLKLILWRYRLMLRLWRKSSNGRQSCLCCCGGIYEIV